MFTGIIEEVGKISKIKPIPGGKQLRITLKEILNDIKIGDSIAVNGICLTVTQLEDDAVWVDTVGSTLDKTTFKFLSELTQVNLERALQLTSRLGGHMVQGHVNGIGEIISIKKLGENYFIEVFIPGNLHKYIVEEGSITIDGVSLTVSEINESRIVISIIPHTWNSTNLNCLRVNQAVNVETDIIAKYIEKILMKSQNGNENFSKEWFSKLGYTSENNSF